MTSVVLRLQAVSRRDEAVATLGVIAAAGGALSAVPVHTPLRAVLFLAFLLAGPGAAIVCWIDLPIAATVAAVIGVSISAVTAVAVTMAWLQFWHPVPTCLVLTAATAAGCLFRLRSRLSTGAARW